jgi:hypothetical protein
MVVFMEMLLRARSTGSLQICLYGFVVRTRNANTRRKKRARSTLHYEGTV